MPFENDADQKANSILKILGDSDIPLGARVIAQRLKDRGIQLGERAVRYHLKLMDEKGMTRLVSRDGRLITDQGRQETQNALVRHKVGFALSKIELLSFRTSFDLEKRTGLVPVNISLFPADKFARALQAMKPVFRKGICVSDLVKVAQSGERIGDLLVPRGMTGLATVCSIIVNGCLVKAGIPMDSRFGGILEVRQDRPFRFIELIQYSGSSLDPSEVFIRAQMTSVAQVARTGEGKILANFREIPAICKPLAGQILGKLHQAGMNGLLLMGNVSESVCEVSVELNKVGLVLVGGLNPVAAAEEADIRAEHRAMSTVIQFEEMSSFWDVLGKGGA